MQNKFVGNLYFLSFRANVSCSAGDGCDCDGDVDECISRGGSISSSVSGACPSDSLDIQI